MTPRPVWMALLATLGLGVADAQAEEIVVGNYGVAANGFPFAVAMAKGYFKEEGANVTGIISSAGGGTTLRNMLNGNAPYAEVNPGVVAVAAQENGDLRIVSDNVLTCAESVWVVKPDSPIKSLADFKGKKIGFTNPRSTSQALSTLLLQKIGLKPEDAQLTRTGGFGEGIAALELGQLDIAQIPEPLWARHESKYRVVVRATEALPPLDNVVGATTVNAIATKGDFIRAVIRARRRAVEFMYKNPDEAAEIIAKPYNLTPDEAKKALRNLITADTQGIPYWGSGQIHLEGMKRILEVQKMVGALSGEFDLSKLIDTSLLPDDIKAFK